MHVRMLKALRGSAEQQIFTHVVSPQTVFASFKQDTINLFLKKVLTNAVTGNSACDQFSSIFHVS